MSPSKANDAYDCRQSVRTSHSPYRLNDVSTTVSWSLRNIAGRSSRPVRPLLTVTVVFHSPCVVPRVSPPARCGHIQPAPHGQGQPQPDPQLSPMTRAWVPEIASTPMVPLDP